MASQIFKLDCTSPLLNYQAPNAWRRGGFDGDPDAIRYDESTFNFADVTGATLSFNFTGTFIQIVGAYRSNDGQFSVQLDDGPAEMFRTNASETPTPDNQQYQQSLFSKSGLEQGQHQVVVTNMGSGELNHWDIDFITFTTSYDSSTDVKVQSDAFQYEPESSWTFDNTLFTGFDGDSGNATDRPNASVSIKFSGSHITLFGAIGDSGSPYTVQLDKGDILSFNGTRPGYGYLPQQILYHTDNIEEGDHDLVVTSQPSQIGQYLSVDYAIIDGKVNNGTATSPKGTLSVASIAGIAVGIVAVISALLFALFILYRRRRPPNKHQDNTMPTDVVRVPMSTVVPFALQTSVAVHHRGGTGLYTPATESFTTDRFVPHSGKPVPTTTWMTEPALEPPPRYSKHSE